MIFWVVMLHKIYLGKLGMLEVACHEFGGEYVDFDS